MPLTERSIPWQGTAPPGYTGNGGLATSATLNYPTGVFVDAAGNIFIADSANNRIRKVNASDGKINTIAGTGTGAYTGNGGLATLACLNYPSGVFVDAAGNIFIADSANNRVRRVNASDKKIIAVAGGSAGVTESRPLRRACLPLESLTHWAISS